VRYATLGSGSRGNCTVVQHEGVSVLVDCGLTLRDARRGLDALGVQAQDVAAVLVTHEHGDHGRGVPALARALRAPVLASFGTARAVKGLEGPELIAHDDRLDFGPLSARAVTVPHDAQEPLQFVFEVDGAGPGVTRLGVLTDLGHVSPLVRERFGACDALLLETNHDPERLWQGRYPVSVKRRVAGDWGHLSNAQAAALLAEVDLDRLTQVTLAHVSQENNDGALALAQVAAAVDGRAVRLELATQDEVCGWHEVVPVGVGVGAALA
jgi:phosphoribosyl 1,2-cyclic phosphodiesterase